MKQPKRNFVIEYKSGRRRSSTVQSNSIWGDLDLKSVARAVETDLPKQAVGIDGPAEHAPSKRLAQDIVSEADTPTNIVSPPDGQNVAGDVNQGAFVDYDALIDDEEAVDGNYSRGFAEIASTREPARSEPIGVKHEVRRVRQVGASTGRKPARTVRTQPTLSDADKELADLFQLEEENRQLRRLLVTKLRGENGWLRERLRDG
ncbi:hypothetical protein [Agrobacterium sp. NPDC089420]|uniref:hypothetical protein n=1 Tax=Agrobacterium sp. NPDC089420 TaxID=3363918 RepID=UPI0038511AE2